MVLNLLPWGPRDLALPLHPSVCPLLYKMGFVTPPTGVKAKQPGDGLGFLSPMHLSRSFTTGWWPS